MSKAKSILLSARERGEGGFTQHTLAGAVERATMSNARVNGRLWAGRCARRAGVLDLRFSSAAGEGTRRTVSDVPDARAICF